MAYGLHQIEEETAERCVAEVPWIDSVNGRLLSDKPIKDRLEHLCELWVRADIRSVVPPQGTVSWGDSSVGFPTGQDSLRDSIVHVVAIGTELLCIRPKIRPKTVRPQRDVSRNRSITFRSGKS
jgi:hypothetical protein